MALMEDGKPKEEPPAVCSCSTKCETGTVNTACPVCATDMSKCTGKTPEPPAETSEPEKEKPAGLNPAALILLLALLGGGGVFAYLKLVKNKPKTKGNDSLDDYDYGEEDSEEWETEDEEVLEDGFEGSDPTWDCIDIAPQSIENGSAYIFVNKELQRVTRGALDDLSDKGVIKKFPPCIASTHTALVLKEPKTKTSIRRVYLPKTVAYMLVERKKEIDELMELFGDEYIDNNLVFCSSNGRPMESQVINRAFNKLIKENGLPHVVFHSLRHSSITYKLKLNGGDMKSVQGDSGHAQVKMVADVYSHIIDEDRCINAQRLEEAFYSSKTPDPVEDTEPKTADTAVTESDESDAAKILELLKNPETAALLKQLAKAL